MDFSILCPSRGRPENLKRLIESIRKTASNIQAIEILVYLDDDDSTVDESDFEDYSNVKFFRGRRVWMSNAQNFLYCKSRGEILMACADDFVFRTEGWDLEIKREFEKSHDKIQLVFGNDLGIHAGKIPTHFFLHKTYPEALGTWVMPGRASLWDLWHYETSKAINRITYRDDLVIEHLNFRQTKSPEVIFDQTTRDVTSTQYMFRPKLTYEKLYRERRIDTLLLAEKAGIKSPIQARYFLSHGLRYFLRSKLSRESGFRLLSMSNAELITLPLQRIRNHFLN